MATSTETSISAFHYPDKVSHKINKSLFMDVD